MTRVPRLTLRFLLVLVLIGAGVAASWWWSRPVLKLYTWDGYLPPDVLREFSLEYGVRIKQKTYTKNAEMLARVKVSWSEFDVIMPSNYMIAPMRGLQLLTKMVRGDLPNLAYLQPEFLNGQLGEAEDVAYGVPYMKNYLGIGYRKSAVSTPPRTWREFFSRTTAQMHGRRLMIVDEERELLGLVLIALGFSPNTHDEAQLAAVREFLREEGEGGTPRLVLGEGRDLLLEGKGVLLQTWSPEVTLAQRTDSDIGYIMPEDGSLLTVDTLAIPRSSNQQELAKQFINFLLRPSIAARVTAFSRYANTLDPKYDHVDDALKRSPSYAEPPPGKRYYLTDVSDAQHLYDVLWAEFKQRNMRE